MEQKYWKVPAVSKVTVNESPEDNVPECQSSVRDPGVPAVDVWGKSPRFSHLTMSPTETVRTLGWKKKSPMVTSPAAGSNEVGGAGALVEGGAVSGTVATVVVTAGIVVTRAAVGGGAEGTDDVAVGEEVDGGFASVAVAAGAVSEPEHAVATTDSTATTNSEARIEIEGSFPISNRNRSLRCCIPDGEPHSVLEGEVVVSTAVLDPSGDGLPSPLSPSPGCGPGARTRSRL